jgi:hypothetical protein
MNRLKLTTEDTESTETELKVGLCNPVLHCAKLIFISSLFVSSVFSVVNPTLI